MRLIPWIFISAAALTVVPFGASAAGPQLAEPVVQLMPHLKQLRPSLELDAQQARAIDNWIAEAPAKRKQMEAEMKQLRVQMREAILNNESRLVREDLKAKIVDQEMRLIEMRALCARMLRKTLTADQFARVVASYRSEVSG